MKRVAVEHSEPGYVIDLSDSLEYTLRHLSWERVEELARELAEFAKDLPGGEALGVFHLEAPGETGTGAPNTCGRNSVSRTGSCGWPTVGTLKRKSGAAWTRRAGSTPPRRWRRWSSCFARSGGRWRH